jgi:hypothetical protein
VEPERPAGYSGYRPSDVAQLRQALPGGGYDELINWLQHDNGRTLPQPVEAELTDDLSKLRQSGAALPRDPDDLYRQLTSLR